jgi:hypothetical protein
MNYIGKLVRFYVLVQLVTGNVMIDLKYLKDFVLYLYLIIKEIRCYITKI